MKKVVLLKKIGRNNEGYVSYPSDRTGLFPFNGFQITLELAEDDSTLFKVIDYENYQCDICSQMVDSDEVETIKVYGNEADACEKCREGKG